MPNDTEPQLAFLQGGGELGALIREKDWAATPLGPVDTWPQSLKTTLGIVLNSRYPMFVFWGPELIKIYNDGYRPITGHKHPWALGRPAPEVWPEIWSDIKPLVDRALGGEPTWSDDLLLFMERNGFPEEVYFTFSYSPVPDESGGIGGMFCACTETTQQVLGERRLRALRDLADGPAEAHSVADACERSAAVLGRCAADVPFALIYLSDGEGGPRLAASVGVDSGDAPSAEAWPMIGAVMDLKRSQQVADLSTRVPIVPAGPWPEPPSSAMVLPLIDRGLEGAAGALVVGISSRRPFDEEYHRWCELVAGQISANISYARALESEKRRAEALAELDRAKTAFFSNVSHEFRTPLTLMLGPIADALASPEGALAGHALETVHRNAHRLLKLVNTLLDFTRIEAGRVNARLEPVDLPQLTADLASTFRSAIERAGLSLVVDCPPLPWPVSVDRGMWEKIVLNLLSNALKFTFTGSIAVELSAVNDAVDLRVRDTGIGIAAADLPRVFDRFHRIDGPGGRTQEGSGIGLALVRELVALHGGSVQATSTPGEGSVFHVRVPARPAPVDLPASASSPAPAATLPAATPFIEEALRWLPSPLPTSADATTPAPDAPPNAVDARVLVADDNADMRDYLARLLSPRFAVETVADGRAALEAARRWRPDVILSDIMMPDLDGTELVAAIRADETLRSVPVLLLSARAGEDALDEGLRTGADDYLVKPFSARELVARIETQLVRARFRSVEEASALRLATVFSHAPVGIAILRGPAHVFEFANAQYRELVAGREIVGRPIREALPELGGQGIVELLDGVYATGQPYVGRSLRTLIQRSGETAGETFFDFVYQPLFDGDGGVTGIAVVAFDVTALTRARRDAEAASRAKDEFLAMLGHELRNPLAPILTALQLMRLRNVGGVEREQLVIERQVTHLVSLVDDLLDVSRITRGKVRLNHDRIDMADIVAKAIEMTSPAIEDRRHVLDVQVPRGLLVDGDAARLSQVVANLVTNAAKYTDPAGTIGIRAARETDAIVVRVVDSGRGIAPEMLPHVFDLFTQERQELDRSEGGLGLGLAIVRSLVQAHGGLVEAHSAGKGHGATFTIRLPAPAEETRGATPAMAPHAPETAADRHEGLRILVVDDNRDAADLLADSLQMLGHGTRVAFDGPTALAVAEEYRPDTVLLDIGLPVMDGFEVAERLQATANAADFEIVAITGYGQAVDRRRTKQLGFADHFVKPVDLYQLEAWLLARKKRLSAGSRTT